MTFHSRGTEPKRIPNILRTFSVLETRILSTCTNQSHGIPAIKQGLPALVRWRGYLVLEYSVEQLLHVEL